MRDATLEAIRSRKRNMDESAHVSSQATIRLSWSMSPFNRVVVRPTWGDHQITGIIASRPLVPNEAVPITSWSSVRVTVRRED